MPGANEAQRTTVQSICNKFAPVDIASRTGKRPNPPVTAPTRSLRPYVRNAIHVRAQYGEVDITTPVAKEKICTSSTAPGMRRQHALRWASGCKVGVQRQLVDGDLINAGRQIRLMNLMLSHARKWHGATLRVQIVSQG